MSDVEIAELNKSQFDELITLYDAFKRRYSLDEVFVKTKFIDKKTFAVIRGPNPMFEFFEADDVVPTFRRHEYVWSNQQIKWIEL